MTANLDAATEFIHSSARLLERHRFAHLFQGADAEPVLRALRAYRNPDGGFGHALEPDVRDPASQPIPTQSALEILHETGAHDDPMIAPAAEFLAGIARPDGGIPFALPSALEHPHAPHIRGAADASSIIQTSANAAALYTLGVDHPWLDRASEFCFDQIARLDPANDPGVGYSVRFSIWFLDAVPDGERAESALDSLAGLQSSGMIHEPGATGDIQTPLDISPWPGSRSRRLFDADLIERHLDALAGAQQDDGGWTFGWEAWNPAGAHEWRGIMTVHALKVLRANGRL
jgi:hypothetical protein